MFKRFILFGLIVQISFSVQALSKVKKFEGSIKLKKETVYDTSYVTIQVKGNQVRLDEYDCKKNLVSIYIINLESEKVLALSPKNRLFYELRPSQKMQISNNDTTVIKTENRMMFDGQSCCQMRVKCISSDTEVAFWVTENNFDFFTSMNKVLRKYKPNINIFSYFPDINGVFPLLTVERTLLRKEKMKIQVTGIREALLSEALFKIPLGYQKIEQ
jgi:hypothetical protein